jgi:hypothetical protein
MTEWSIATILVVLSFGGPSPYAAQEASLNRDEAAKWIAVGQRCEAPLIRIPSRDGSFEIYIESPAARAAVVAAAAMMNHQPIDARRVQTAIRAGYRVWASYTDLSPRTIRIEQMTVRSAQRPEIKPASIRDERLSLGIAPSHGIVEAVRVRFPEFEFLDLPHQDFWLVLRTNRGLQRYLVPQNRRLKLVRVCN